MAVSLKDISKATGINTCSVSQVLNNHPKAMSLRPETREKILAAAKELGYCKNEMAASLICKNSKVLAFITCPMGSVEYTGIIQNGILNTAGASGYTIIVYRLETMSEEEIIAKIIGWRVAGVIFHVEDRAKVRKITDTLAEKSISFGFVNLSNPDGIGVTSDDRQGIVDAVRYLKEKGHKKIALARIPLRKEIEYDIRRVQGYRDGIAEYFPEQDEIILNIPDLKKEYDNKCLTDIVRKIISEKIDGVICTGDIIAAGLNNAALQLNYHVPEDFSLVGFGNSVVSEMFFPPLTTVFQDFSAMGQETVNFIIESIEKKNTSAVHNIMLPTSIIERKSVKNLK